MPRYFPSKKVFVVGVFAIVLLAWSVVSERAPQQSKPVIAETILRTVALADSAFPDTDDDGLYDWEEELYGTDSNDTDSDNDGVEDGPQYKKSTSFSPRLSDSIFAAVNRFGEDAGNALDPTSLLSTEPVEYESPHHLYNIRSVPSEETYLQAYFLSLAIIFEANKEMLDKDPLNTIGEWIESENPDTLEELAHMSDQRKAIASDLMILNVPEGIEIEHLTLANSLHMEGLSLDDVEKTISDPMAGFFASASYINYQSKRTTALQDIAEYLSKN